MFTKLLKRVPRYMLIKSFFLAISSYLHDLSHLFTLRRMKLLWGEILYFKSVCFLKITAKHQECPVFTVFLTIKSSSQNISIIFSLKISLKLHEHQGGYWRKKLKWTILEEKFPLLRNTAASKIGNGIILFPLQLWCHCNPDHNTIFILI